MRATTNTFHFLAIFLVCVWAFVGKTYAATHAAASCTYADVSAAINAASIGDTVLVPSGSCIWSSQLNITKGIYLIGAGIGNTVITTTPGIAIKPLNYWLNAPVRISGFTFIGPASSGSDTACIWIGEDGTPEAPYTVQTNVRIDHNRFVGGGSDTSGNEHGIIFRGGVYGVVDNNVFDTFCYMMRNINTAHGSDWWDAHLNEDTGFEWTFGDQYKLYFEDNTFNFGNAVGYNMVSNSQFSGRYAFRYNTFNMNDSAYPFLDMHGYQYSDMHSSFGGEVYGNRVNSANGNFYETRGGSSLIFCNSFSSSSMSLETSSSAVACPAETYIDEEMVHDTYFFQNRVGYTGSLVDAYNDDSGISCGGHTRPLRGTDFFDNNSSPGVSCGTLANRPSTCSTGQVYWATDQSCSDLTGMVGVNPSTQISGTLYRCTSTNTWTEIFTPYAYPHPLRGPSPPLNLQIIEK